VRNDLDLQQKIKHYRELCSKNRIPELRDGGDFSLQSLLAARMRQRLNAPTGRDFQHWIFDIISDISGKSGWDILLSTMDAYFDEGAVPGRIQHLNRLVIDYMAPANAVAETRDYSLSSRMMQGFKDHWDERVMESVARLEQSPISARRLYGSSGPSTQG
jgi:hypothetical protein